MVYWLFFAFCLVAVLVPHTRSGYAHVCTPFTFCIPFADTHCLYHCCSTATHTPGCVGSTAVYRTPLPFGSAVTCFTALPRVCGLGYFALPVYTPLPVPGYVLPHPHYGSPFVTFYHARFAQLRCCHTVWFTVCGLPRTHALYGSSLLDCGWFACVHWFTTHGYRLRLRLRTTVCLRLPTCYTAVLFCGLVDYVPHDCRFATVTTAFWFVLRCTRFTHLLHALLVCCGYLWFVTLPAAAVHRLPPTFTVYTRATHFGHYALRYAHTHARYAFGFYTVYFTPVAVAVLVATLPRFTFPYLRLVYAVATAYATTFTRLPFTVCRLPRLPHTHLPRFTPHDACGLRLRSVGSTLLRSHVVAWLRYTLPTFLRTPHIPAAFPVLRLFWFVTVYTGLYHWRTPLVLVRLRSRSTYAVARRAAFHCYSVCSAFPVAVCRLHTLPFAYHWFWLRYAPQRGLLPLRLMPPSHTRTAHIRFTTLVTHTLPGCTFWLVRYRRALYTRCRTTVTVPHITRHTRLRYLTVFVHCGLRTFDARAFWFGCVAPFRFCSCRLPHWVTPLRSRFIFRLPHTDCLVGSRLPTTRFVGWIAVGFCSSHTHCRLVYVTWLHRVLPQLHARYTAGSLVAVRTVLPATTHHTAVGCSYYRLLPAAVTGYWLDYRFIGYLLYHTPRAVLRLLRCLRSATHMVTLPRTRFARFTLHGLRLRSRLRCRFLHTFAGCVTRGLVTHTRCLPLHAHTVAVGSACVLDSAATVYGSGSVTGLRSCMPYMPTTFAWLHCARYLRYVVAHGYVTHTVTVAHRTHGYRAVTRLHAHTPVCTLYVLLVTATLYVLLPVHLCSTFIYLRSPHGYSYCVPRLRRLRSALYRVWLPAVPVTAHCLVLVLGCRLVYGSALPVLFTTVLHAFPVHTQYRCVYRSVHYTRLRLPPHTAVYGCYFTFAYTHRTGLPFTRARSHTHCHTVFWFTVHLRFGWFVLLLLLPFSSAHCGSTPAFCLPARLRSSVYTPHCRFTAFTLRSWLHAARLFCGSWFLRTLPALPHYYTRYGSAIWLDYARLHVYGLFARVTQFTRLYCYVAAFTRSRHAACYWLVTRCHSCLPVHTYGCHTVRLLPLVPPLLPFCTRLCTRCRGSTFRVPTTFTTVTPAGLVLHYLRLRTLPFYGLVRLPLPVTHTGSAVIYLRGGLRCLRLHGCGYARTVYLRLVCVWFTCGLRFTFCLRAGWFWLVLILLDLCWLPYFATWVLVTAYTFGFYARYAPRCRTVWLPHTTHYVCRAAARLRALGSRAPHCRAHAALYATTFAVTHTGCVARFTRHGLPPTRGCAFTGCSCVWLRYGYRVTVLVLYAVGYCWLRTPYTFAAVLPLVHRYSYCGWLRLPHRTRLVTRYCRLRCRLDAYAPVTVTRYATRYTGSRLLYICTVAVRLHLVTRYGLPVHPATLHTFIRFPVTLVDVPVAPHRLVRTVYLLPFTGLPGYVTAGCDTRGSCGYRSIFHRAVVRLPCTLFTAYVRLVGYTCVSTTGSPVLTVLRFVALRTLRTTRFTYCRLRAFVAQFAPAVAPNVRFADAVRRTRTPCLVAARTAPLLPVRVRPVTTLVAAFAMRINVMFCRHVCRHRTLYAFRWRCCNA